jgi:hypothetical protein
MMRYLVSWPAGIALLLSATTARGDDDPARDQPRNLTAALLQSAGVLAVMGGVYWSKADPDGTDVDLAWNWSSWKDKLTFDALRFDTNEFSTNAVGHPVMGVLQFHIGRANGLTLLGSTGLVAAQIVIWEYLIEFREYPSLNDLVTNVVGGVAIGEPLWQIGQLWRGGQLTIGDRLKTALFSPLDAVGDAVSRRHHRWTRPRAWRSIVLEAGAMGRRLDDETTRGEVALSGDIDIVSDPRHVAAGPQDAAIRAGTWSRIRGRLLLGDDGVVATQVQSRTALAGSYHQDERGNGRLVALGTAFTYRRDLVEHGWDHVALFHALGPQLQLSRRTPSLAVRWDLALYADLALIDAHVFGGNALVRPPPPYVSSLQAHGYYYGLGGSGITRLRVARPAWTIDAELGAHQAWQITGANRVSSNELAAPGAYLVKGVADLRVYTRIQLGVRRGAFGFAAIAEGNVRRGTWRSDERTTSELALGLLGQLDL